MAAGTQLIIDDDYCKKMGEYFETQGAHLDQTISKYVGILQEIKRDGVKSGDTAKALDAYITYVKKLEKQIGKISGIAKSHANNFVTRVDAADQYLF